MVSDIPWIIEVETTKAQWDRGTELKKYANTNQKERWMGKSHPDAEVHGYFAQAIVGDVFPRLQHRIECWSVDYWKEDETFDVKNSVTNTVPQMYQDATLGMSLDEKTGLYVDTCKAKNLIFTRTLRDRSKAWICGVMNRGAFKEVAPYRKAGYKARNYTTEFDIYLGQYEQLVQSIDWLEWLK